MPGKVKVILFFQSWCPKCNEWSGGVVRDLETAYADDPRFMLIGVKTDGGLDGARRYLEEREANPDKWLLASDADAQWYTQVFGEAKLWEGVILGPDGSILKKGYVGHFSNRAVGGVRNNFAVAKFNTLQQHEDQLETVLEITERPESVLPAVRAVETGDWMTAYTLLQNVRQDRDAADALREEMNTAITAQVEALRTRITEGEGDDRFLAFRRLRDWNNDMRRHEAFDGISRDLRAWSREDDLKTQLVAEKQWLGMMQQIERVRERDRAAAEQQGYALFAEKYPDTYYGRLAASRISQ